MIRSLSGPGAQALGSAGLAAALACFAVVALAVPRPLPAQESGEGDELPSAGEIVAEMFEREASRSEEVERYATESFDAWQDAMLANESQDVKALRRNVMEKVYCQLPSGETRVIWRAVDGAEKSAREKEAVDENEESESEGEGKSDKLRKAAAKMGLAGLAFNRGMANEGVPVGFLSLISPVRFGGSVEDDTGTERHYAINALNPGSVISGYAIFLNAMADGVDMVNSLKRTAREFCKAELGNRYNMADDLKTVSREQVGNREAWQLEAMMNETFQIAGGSEPNLEDVFALLPDVSDMSWSSRPTANPANLVAGPRSSGTEADIEYTVRKFTLQVDTEHYVPLLVRIEGIVTEDGEAKPLPVIIEKEYRSYRLVPDTEMLLPYLEVMRIWGFQDLGPEMEEAQREMAKLKAELAKLPPKDRAMAERMMGDRIKQMEAMAEGGAIVVENRIEEIIVNPGLPHNPTSATNPIVLECMPGDTDCVEPDLARAETTNAATDTDSDPPATQD